MKSTTKFALGIAASLGLGLAVATAHAHPGGMGHGMGPGMMGGMGPGAGMHQGMMGGAGPWAAAQQLMTPEERTALHEKMLAAKTPQERQTIALANRAEMEKRAKEKGITLPEARGPHGGHGHGYGYGPR